MIVAVAELVEAVVEASVRAGEAGLRQARYGYHAWRFLDVGKFRSPFDLGSTPMAQTTNNETVTTKGQALLDELSGVLHALLRAERR